MKPRLLRRTSGGTLWSGTSQSRTELVPGNGSGDWVAAAGSVGFIEVPPGEPAQGLRPFHAW